MSGSKKQGLKRFTCRSTVLLLEAGRRIKYYVCGTRSTAGSADLTGFEAGAMATLTRFEGWSKEEVNVLVSGAKRDVRNPNVHTPYYSPLVGELEAILSAKPFRSHVVCGQKPTSPTEP